MRVTPFVLLLGAAFGASAQAFELTSPQFQEGQKLESGQVFKGFGCSGSNNSPQLDWRNPPAGTKSYAVTVYDPDAPTGSGWWHWQVYNLPARETGLLSTAGSRIPLPKGALQGRNDYGQKTYGGPCPPTDGRIHRYIFTVWALKVPKLDLPADPSAAMVGYAIRANELGRAVLTGIYSR